MKNLSIILFMVLITLPIGAVKVDPQPATVVQRDGTKLTVILHGDEDFHWYTTTDNVFLAHVGYDYYVADIDDDGNLTPTMQLAHEKTDRSSQEVLLIERQMNKSVFITNANRHKKEKQQQRISIGTSTPPYLTHTGSPNVLVILVQFSDLIFSLENPQKSFQDYLNGESPLTNYGLREDRNYGSVRQYFHDMSQGLFEPIFDVNAPVTLSKSWTYYGANLSELIEESCKLVDNQIDFSKYDNDRDGYVDHLSIIFAGYSGNVSGTSSYCIWPTCGEFYSNECTYDGVKICRYGLTGELNYYPDKTYQELPYKRINGIGIFCNIFSHTLGLPNIYPTSYEAKLCDNQSMEYWDLLDIGSYTDNGYTPTPYTPWEMCVMGWADIEDLGSAERKVTLPEKKYYKIATDNDYEYLILQNLQNNYWASKMLGHGLIVYRIDYQNMFVTKDDNPNNTAGKPGITLVPADQLLISSTRVYQNESERSEAKPYSSEEYVQSFYGDPYPGTAGVTDLPIVRLNHTTITKPICNIKEENGIITFDYLKIDEPSGSVTKTVDGTTVTLMVDGAIEGEKVTVDLNAQGWENGEPVNPAAIILADGTKITFDKGEGSNMPSFYATTKGVRIYAKNTITISGKAVAKVVLYCDSYNNTAYVGNSTLYGSANGTTFVICNEFSENKGGDQLRVQKIDIIYATGTGTKQLPDDLEYVDLGLPSGTLWANMNLGANAITDFGDYYAWGEVGIKSNYSSKTYRFYDTWIVNDTTYIDDNGFTINEKGGTFSGFTKYVLKKDAEEYGYKGFYDNLTQLDVNDDAAYFNWGKEWRMPTKQQFLELINNCTWNWATINGKEGYKVTGITGNYIFLPAAGYRENDNPYHPGDVFYETQESNGGKIGVYLSSDIGYWSSYATGLYIGSWVNNTQNYSIDPFNVNGWSQGYRFRGHSIRAVYVGKNTFTISVSAFGNGSAIYNGTTIRNDSKSFSVEEGTNTSVSFTPDNGYRIASVKVNNMDVTSQLSNNQYTVSNIKSNTTVTVTFTEIEYSSLTNEGVNYRVVSNPNKTVSVASGSYGYWLTVPASFTANGFEWSVTGIDNDVITGNPQLAAVIWNPSTQFTASVDNPNFLLYVTSSQYAPSAIKNVVVGNTANSITLTDASSGNNFYCPREFTARSISYSHSYGMTTGISEARGWESISLPFDVETITHSSKGTLVPFTNWQEGGSTKPFWLYQLGSGGFAETSSIKANTPYIISMPNNAEYKDEYRVSGTITFSATDVTVKSSESLQNGTYGDRTFVPNFINQDANSGFYVLNAVNNYSANSSGYAEGSRFVRNLRAIHPFEAYIASANNAKESFPIFDDTPTWIQLIENSKLIMDRVYNLSGQQVKIEGDHNYGSLKKGVYIVNGKKVVIK